MNILLSAYACEPNKGSEPGVGWGWAIELVKQGHNVYVITRSNNQHTIENHLSGKYIKGLTFIYYDLSPVFSWWKKGRVGIHLYYFLWQINIFFIAKKILCDVNIDLIHHVTFVSARQPSFLGGLGIPFIFGPVAGGESIPMKLRKNMGMKLKITEFLRDIANKCVKYDPMMRYTYRSAKKIYVTSTQTLDIIPSQYRNKADVNLAISIPAQNNLLGKINYSQSEGLKVLYVGNFLFLKGMTFGIKAFANFLDKSPESTLTLVGQGEEKVNLEVLINELGIGSRINWVNWLPQNELKKLYLDHDVLLFPSLRDSGGLVVLEAMSTGMPVICTDLGGPGVIVDESCGFRVNSKSLVVDIENALLLLESDRETLSVLSKGAINRAALFAPDIQYTKIYGDYSSHSYKVV